jgi:hypothetical protein
MWMDALGHFENDLKLGFIFGFEKDFRRRIQVSVRTAVLAGIKKNRLLSLVSKPMPAPRRCRSCY